MEMGEILTVAAIILLVHNFIHFRDFLEMSILLLDLADKWKYFKLIMYSVTRLKFLGSCFHGGAQHKKQSPLYRNIHQKIYLPSANMEDRTLS